MLFLARMALAAGTSADIELIRPAFSPGDTPIADSPNLTRPGTVLAGLLFQYEREPLVLYRFGNPAGAVVAARDTLHLGVSVDLSRTFAMRLTMPLSWEWDSEVPQLATQGWGAGDLQAGARAHLWTGGPLNVGVRTDLILPVGTKESWRSEESVRVVPGVLAMVDVGPVSLLTDTGVMIRGPVDTGRDFVLGPELDINVALRGEIWRKHVAVWGGVVDRAGLAALFAGGAENVAEIMVGSQLTLFRDFRVDIGVGKGLSEGYGSSQFRIFTGLTWTRVPVPRARPVTAIVSAPLENVPDSIIITPIDQPKPDWKPDELAKVVADQIVIRDPIQFEFAKDVILPVSFPTMVQIAAVMETHPEIGHIVIEGHASEEGSFLYNYNLSNLRANAIFRELVQHGVHPTRMSTRSMGEVEPTTLETDEASLERNRRVVFHIVHRIQPGDPAPVYSATVPLPWTGETVAITPLPPLPAPPPPPKPPPDPNAEPDFSDDADDDPLAPRKTEEPPK